MKVSLVEVSDVPEIEALCKRAFDQMDYSNTRGYNYDSDHIRSVITKGCQSWNHICTKCVSGGKIVGFMGVEVLDFCFYSIDYIRANEIVWHGDPDCGPIRQLMIQRALLEDMITRTDAMGAHLQVGIDSKFPQVGKMLLKMGFDSSSEVYTRRSQ